ncbi:hypothetical protein K470DRAFT_284822 [Piedraia hortae CBS 480.64]|uniref:Uncharacterized protein n=1 Tax=Piedraia hortae CBS 480.64 TaxID=1314780 RepID=A0A6A7C3D2_9PEZI|nr:hypothetical protein K470DRAFT_284822 [Piedraia hortae CBS 480.64]
MFSQSYYAPRSKRKRTRSCDNLAVDETSFNANPNEDTRNKRARMLKNSSDVAMNEMYMKSQPVPMEQDHTSFDSDTEMVTDPPTPLYGREMKVRIQSHSRSPPDERIQGHSFMRTYHHSDGHDYSFLSAVTSRGTTNELTAPWIAHPPWFSSVLQTMDRLYLERGDPYRQENFTLLHVWSCAHSRLRLFIETAATENVGLLFTEEFRHLLIAAANQRRW